MTIMPKDITKEKKMIEEVKEYLNKEKEDIELIKEDETLIQTEDYFEVMKNDLDEFEEKSWSKGDGYKTPRFPMISEKLEGIDSGLYLLPA